MLIFENFLGGGNMDFIYGCLMVLAIVFSLILSGEHNHRNGCPAGHWVLGFIAGVFSTLLFIKGIWG